MSMQIGMVSNEPDRQTKGGLLESSVKLLDKTIFSCLLGLMVLVVIPYGTVDAWWEAVFECAMFALTAVWLIEVLLSGRWQLRRLYILIPLLLLTAYAFTQTVELPAAWLTVGNRLIAHETLSIDRYQTYLTARKTLALTLFLGLLLLHTSTPRRLHWVVRVLAGLGLASALFGLVRQYLQSPESETGFVLPFLYYGTGYGQFISPNVFAYLMEMTFAIVAGLLVGGGVRRNRVLIYLAVVMPIWTALVLSNSRGGIVGLVVQALFLLFVSLSWYSAHRILREEGQPARWLVFLRASPLPRVLLVVLMVMTLGAGVLWMGGQQLGLKLSQGANISNQPGLDEIRRKEIWRASWEIIKHNPLTGVGFGNYFLAVPQYQRVHGAVKLEEAHNDYLDLAANGGIIAVGLAGCFIGMIIWRTRFSLRSRDAYRRAAALGAAAGILSVGVHSLVDFGLQITGIGVIFAALLVIAIADSRVESVSSERKGQPRPVKGLY